MNRQWQLASRPAAEPRTADFRLRELAIPEGPRRGEVLLRNRYLSLDPYMRWRMNDAKSYAPPVGLGEVMVGATISEVVASEAEGLAPGDLVVAGGGWQDYALQPAAAVRRIDSDGVEPIAYLGALGSPGFTAYAGLMKIAQPQPGETVVVGAATGPVGSMVGQLARSAGCSTVAIAGGAEKCGLARSHFGFDAAVDHRDANFKDRLAAACPKGIDVYFENIGGPVLDAVIPLLNDFARVPVCGVISQYNGAAGMPATTPLDTLMRNALVKRLTLRGFIVTDFAEYRDEFIAKVAPLVTSGAIARLEDVVDGLERAPEAFVGMLRGANRGKLIVRID
ncbi:NADP-dependent oxidoreductase [Pseudohoeflea coraliihabitans]|uniref:NADP-dependent oxidoreductase n=1 Tax=Pseudohoeflea coraliihabitans TaxID=2860393 RepID=A0ABS6WR49_9HYPH|nr:NADP-dependent oxidoreductase [Pseudohoeflea sp. DP4N28-3]MBW3098447.1 NADP-dependent oxidoreductase [Pseudohoeflea sp. DP4N28-3]